jgi:hypothetical protein
MRFYRTLLNLLEKDRYVFITLIALSFLIFFPSFLNHDFFWDDERFVFLNPEVLQAPHWYSFWNFNSVFYKSWPIGYAIFWSLMKAVPAASLAFYKCLNIIFHGINGFLVYKLVKDFKFRNPILLSLIFLVHPLHVESVSWIFQLLTILSFSFFLGSFFLLLEYIYRNKIYLLVISLILFLISLWIKSIALFAPFLFVLVFGIFGLKRKKCLFLIPFFLVSLYVGAFNLKGAESAMATNSHAQDQQQYIKKLTRQLEVAIQTIFSPEKLVLKNTEEKQFFDFTSQFEKKKNDYHFNMKKVLAQTPWHYVSQILFPLKLQFIYPEINYNYLLNSAALFLLFILPMLFSFLTRKSIYLIIPGFTLVFLGPYLGFTNIAFFYWSNVSDRYTYGFILVLVFSSGFLLEKFHGMYLKKILLLYIFLLTTQSIIYGCKFNNPLRLYEEIIQYKPHPAIYSSLFDQYILKLDLVNAEKTFAKEVELFPEDKQIEVNRIKLESLQNYSKLKNQ